MYGDKRGSYNGMRPDQRYRVGNHTRGLESGSKTTVGGVRTTGNPSMSEGRTVNIRRRNVEEEKKHPDENRQKQKESPKNKFKSNYYQHYSRPENPESKYGTSESFESYSQYSDKRHRDLMEKSKQPTKATYELNNPKTLTSAKGIELERSTSVCQACRINYGLQSQCKHITCNECNEYGKVDCIVCESLNPKEIPIQHELQINLRKQELKHEDLTPYRIINQIETLIGIYKDKTQNLTKDQETQFEEPEKLKIPTKDQETQFEEPENWEICLPKKETRGGPKLIGNYLDKPGICQLCNENCGTESDFCDHKLCNECKGYRTGFCTLCESEKEAMIQRRGHSAVPVGRPKPNSGLLGSKKPPSLFVPNSKAQKPPLLSAPANPLPQQPPALSVPANSVPQQPPALSVLQSQSLKIPTPVDNSKKCESCEYTLAITKCTGNHFVCIKCKLKCNLCKANSPKCSLCLNYLEDQLQITLPCQETFCKDCIKKYLTHQIENTSELKCPGCGASIPPYITSSIVSEEQSLKLAKFHNSEKKINCPHCQTFFFVDQQDYKEVGCSQCKNMICLKCTMLTSQCKCYEPDFLGLDICKCPYCGNGIEKETGGCNFIRCRSSECRGKNFFCFLCSDKLLMSQHYSHYKKSGPYGSSCNTLDQTQ